MIEGCTPVPELMPIGIIIFIVAVLFAFHMASRAPTSGPETVSVVASSIQVQPPAVAAELPEDETVDYDYEKDTASKQESQYPELAKRLRAAARGLAANGETITADDVWRVCPIPDGVERRIMGVAFTPRIMWRKLGYVASERKENHGRMIPQWQLKEGARGMA